MTKDERILAEISSQDYFDKKRFESLCIEADRVIAGQDFRLIDEVLQKFRQFFKDRENFFKEKIKGVKLKAIFNLVEKLQEEDRIRKQAVQHYFDDIAV